MRKSVTLLDVAKATRVSKTTAANAFNNPERVRAELRARVEAAARELHYAGPDPKGRMLSSGKVNAVGVVSFGEFGISLFFTHAYPRDFLAGVAKVCEVRGVGVSLVSSRADQREWGIQNALVDGFILGGVEQIEWLAQAKQRRLPFVVVDFDGTPDIASLTVDNRGGMRQATRHLIALGHRRFAITRVLRSLRPPIFHPPSKTPRKMVAGFTAHDARIVGIADALAEVGLSINDMPIVETCGTPEEERAFGSGAGMLLDKVPEATAIIALSDGLALSIMEQAKKRGINIPRDLSIVGFDDIADAALSDPPLTTVHQSAFENGQMAATLLLDGGPPRQLVLPVKLVVRGSTAPPRS